MIKYRANGDGGRVILGLGLSRTNVERLMSGQPIHVFGDDLGIMNMEIIVHFGETEETLKNEIASLIGPKTMVLNQTETNPS